MKATLQRKSTSTSSSVAGPFFQPKPERTTGDVETSESREPTFFHSSQVEAAEGPPPIQPQLPNLRLKHQRTVTLRFFSRLAGRRFKRRQKSTMQTHCRYGASPSLKAKRMLSSAYSLGNRGILMEQRGR